MKKFQFSIDCGCGHQSKIFTEDDVRGYAMVSDDTPLTEQVIEEALNVWHWEQIGIGWKEIE